MREVKSHILKLQGKAELPEAIDMGNNYHVSLSGGIKKVMDTDNEDGSIDRTYTFMPIKVEVLNEIGKTIQAKDTRSQSQLFRALIWKRWKDAATNVEFDTFYEGVLNQAMFEVDQLIDRYERRSA